MHELLKHVLNERDLTRAGDLFAIPDSEIVDDLNEVLKQITEISSRPDYCRNDRDQALIEICVTRTTSCIKETGTLAKYCAALVSLLESCLHHNLMPVGHLRDDDPPHAKIASDIIACIVLVSFPLQSDKETSGNKDVMELFLPVAVQFLHKGNREISRHMARYLSLAAVHHAPLLKPHVQTIMDSIMSGNYPLCRILTNLYEVCPEPLEGHVTALVSLLPHAEQVEKNSLFALFEQIAVRRPEALKTCVPQLLSYLCPHTASQTDPSCMCIDLLQLMVCLSRSRAALVCEHGAALRRAARPPHASHAASALVATVLAQLGHTSRERAQEALNFVVERLCGGGGAGGGGAGAERAEQAALLRSATALCSAYPALFTDRLLAALRANNNRPKSTISHSEVNRTSGGVTIVKLGGATNANAGAVIPNPSVATPPAPAATPSNPPVTTGYTRRAKLGDSRSTGRLHTGPNSHRSMTRLNVAGGSVGGLHKSMTRLSSSQQINLLNANQPAAGGVGKGSSGGVAGGGGGGAVPGSPPRAPRHPARHHHHNILIGPSTSTSTGPTIISGPPLQAQSISVNPLTGKSSDALTPLTSSVSIQHSNSALGQISVISSAQPLTNNGAAPAPLAPPAPLPHPVSISGPVTVTSRRANNTSVTMINSSANANTNTNTNANHRISVFEPYPMRDTVQHFCEKHLDKIKAYMDNVSLRLPPPAKCTIEERRSKKQARLQFACGRRGPHCLYARAAFSMRTRAPRVWIHLMFLALQARHAAALSSRDPTVASLKHCWDILKCENKTFLTLVTGAFPAAKEQEMLVAELRAAGFFDVFELSAAPPAPDAPNAPPAPTHAAWGCFLCTRPERAVGFLAAETPVIEGQLKEKKGRWRLFRRWRTRYFTLSGHHLSCKGASGGESIDINQIRSVKVSRGARNIPKAFEIFTGDQTLILKPKDGKNAEEWAQCLSIAVAHSHARDAPAKANSLPARGLTLKSF
ncbi:PREDICTED: ventricular zone-expressed PH domain-containing protein homolog 1 isoform X2 [Papilio polytes]|uniref:ventricular zone-expressed PH domain-containing protein homolog 1 isoform X2 n=1 Tax=Papilio polytes TaxID=76194 RepID=UPI000676590B|nr:PREDICTED: ventricular zone-expressed PH domain-containing protein homolog 1 isoform X2 [Papilio polytes]